MPTPLGLCNILAMGTSHHRTRKLSLGWRWPLFLPWEKEMLGGQGLDAAGHSQRCPALLQDLASFQSPVSRNRARTCRQHEYTHTHTASSIAHEKVHVINRQPAFLSPGRERMGSVHGGGFCWARVPQAGFCRTARRHGL